MARPLRIEYPGALYHVTSRGDRHENIVHDDEDRFIWLEVFSHVCTRFNWRCYAWCLMDNHYHILIETGEGNLSHGMRQLNGVFTQRINRRHDQAGHLFQGRYKAILVEREAHLLELARYVVLNPVCAGMVNAPEDWPWSSYLEMIGEVDSPDWLDSAGLLGYFDKQRNRNIAKYTDFVRAGVGMPSIWENLRHQIFLGGDDFIESLRGKIDPSTLSEVPRSQSRSTEKPLAWYQKNAKDPKEGMALAYDSGRFTMKEIADFFDVHYSTVSRAVKSFEGRD